MAAPGKLEIWTIDDGRAGLANQTKGVADAISALLPANITHHRVKRKIFNFGIGRQMTKTMAAPWPDICIGCGRFSIGPMRAIRKCSGGQTLTVQLQDPNVKPAHFDLVVPPEHDRLEGENVFPILGAPTPISPAILQAAQKQFADKMKQFPGPRLAVVLGGNSKHHKFTKKGCNRLIKSLRGLLGNQVSLLITTSRRTPKYVVKALRSHYGKKDHVWLWANEKTDGPNPYFAFLQAADAVLVTNDSTNMLSEAASAGKPILIFSLKGRSTKFERLYDSLAGKGLARPFTGSLATWPVERLDETNRVAKEIVRRLYSRWQDSGRLPAKEKHTE